MYVPLWFWFVFNAFVLALLALDLGVFHRKAHAVGLREAAIWSAVWVTLGLAFGAVLWVYEGPRYGLEYFTGYVIEKSLSVDNIFVFVTIFSYFAVPATYQHRVLFWGILGALVMRGAFIAGGAYLLSQFHWVMYVFGAILILTGIRLLRHQEVYDPSRNPVLKLARRVLPVSEQFHGPRFVVREGRRWLATPLLLVLIVVEATDVVFAVDSIPAIFAVTREPFLVYTANVFAILGLRAMYFLLAGIIDRFVYLKIGLSAVLVFVGVKMLIVDLYKIPTALSLGVVGLLLTTSMVASLTKKPAEGS